MTDPRTVELLRRALSRVLTDYLVEGRERDVAFCDEAAERIAAEFIVVPADTARTGWAQLHDEWWRGSHKRAEQGDVPVIVLPDPRNKAERGGNKAERGTDE